jgi:hypothetical protein
MTYGMTEAEREWCHLTAAEKNEKQRQRYDRLAALNGWPPNKVEDRLKPSFMEVHDAMAGIRPWEDDSDCWC